MKNKITTVFLNSHNQLRNGWWIALFIALIALTRPVYKPIKSLMLDLGTPEMLLELISPVLILIVTYACIKLRKETFAAVGLRIDRRWFSQFAAGITAGLLMIATLCGTIYLVGGVTFTLNQTFSLGAMATLFYLFFVGALFEELLHRGFLFQRLIDGIGFWSAQLLVATIFAIGHWSNPGMEGAAQWIGSADLFIGSLLFGLAYYKTQSLALPIGLHLGWNWAMGSIFGFNVSGYQSESLLSPQINSISTWLTGGQFGLESSIISPVLGLFAVILLMRWTPKRIAAKEPKIGSTNALQSS